MKIALSPPASLLLPVVPQPATTASTTATPASLTWKNLMLGLLLLAEVMDLLPPHTRRLFGDAEGHPPAPARGVGLPYRWRVFRTEAADPAPPGRHGCAAENAAAGGRSAHIEERQRVAGGSGAPSSASSLRL